MNERVDLGLGCLAFDHKHVVFVLPFGGFFRSQIGFVFAIGSISVELIDVVNELVNRRDDFSLIRQLDDVFASEP
jgi:hypothetical protein